MGKCRLMLLVVWENEAAIALYRKMGFTVTRRRRFRLARAVFGSRGADVMAKPVAQPPRDQAARRASSGSS